MLKVGLTGGIACGKSYVLKQFGKHGAATVDADIISRRVIEPGKPAYDKILQEFGDQIVGPNGQIDRKTLGSLVFGNAEQRKKLNAIVHPYVYQEESQEIEKAREFNTSPMVLVDAALMVEAGSYRNYQVVIVVYCRPDIQMNRLMTRDGLDATAARQRIESQMPVLEKIKYADYVIENSGKLSDTNQQVRHIFMDITSRFELG